MCKPGEDRGGRYESVVWSCVTSKGRQERDEQREKNVLEYSQRESQAEQGRVMKGPTGITARAGVG